VESVDENTVLCLLQGSGAEHIVKHYAMKAYGGVDV
jgi:hypothetical protein